MKALGSKGYHPYSAFEQVQIVSVRATIGLGDNAVLTKLNEDPHFHTDLELCMQPCIGLCLQSSLKHLLMTSADYKHLVGV